MRGRPEVRVGIPLVGGQLVAAARRRGYHVLFSANAFAKTYPKGHAREGFFKGFRLPGAGQFEGLDAALDSAGFVAAAKYRDYRWTVDVARELGANLIRSFSYIITTATSPPSISAKSPGSGNLIRVAGQTKAVGR